jgi:V8-like Glu-specific endopeptidase
MSTLRKYLTVAGATALTIAFASDIAFAQVVQSNRGVDATRYWTPQRMQNAVNYPTPRATPGQTPARPAESGPSQVGQAFAPEVAPKAAPSTPIAVPPVKNHSAPPPSKGSSGYPFTTQLVSPDSLVQTWPYRLGGKLFFTDNGGNFVCTASILRPRIVVTAAHCLYNTAANRWNNNFVFVPAYNGNSSTQPFGSWGWSYAVIPTAWATGAETFPNGNDFGLIEIGDKFIAGGWRQIGNYLGYFGWQTFALIGNHVTQLGYPTNLESGLRMIRNDAEARSAGGGIAGEIGTAIWKGGSGGPWVQDFGIQAAGQYITSTGPNRVVAVSSYVSTANPTPGPQYFGATVFNNTFATILNNYACPHRAGNC